MTIEKADEGQRSEEIQDNIFGDAFDQAENVDVNAADSGAEGKGMQPDPTDNKAGQGDQGAQGAQGDGEQIPAQQPPPTASTPPVEPPPDETFEQKWKTLQGIHKTDREKWEAEKLEMQAKLEELGKPVSPDTPPVPPVKPVENKQQATIPFDIKSILEDLDLTDDQKAKIKDYDETFDEVSQMEGLKRERALTKLAAKLNDEFNNKLNSKISEIMDQLKPAQELVVQTAKEREAMDRESHFQTIEESHPDYDKYVKDGSILQWVESKPSYLRKGLMDIYQKGRAEDIVEFLNDFKTENNISTDTNTRGAIPINKAREDRRAAMTPPHTKRGAINTSMAPANDYDGAFDEALHK
jgi:hypothetical protein